LISGLLSFLEKMMDIGKKNFSASGRIALVTGGSRGIGKMIVEVSSRRAARRLYITAPSMESPNTTIAEFGDRVISLPGDISTCGRYYPAIGRPAERESRLDILVNNAGAAWGQPFGNSAGWLGTGQWI
jgi:NAD(P)-dependent dehydrogenase (short-subunit alcohol dehydrogenase family)